MKKRRRNIFLYNVTESRRILLWCISTQKSPESRSNARLLKSQFQCEHAGSNAMEFHAQLAAQQDAEKVTDSVGKWLLRYVISPV